MLSQYKEVVTGWTDPLAGFLLRLRLRPNHLTILGLGVSLLAALAFAWGRARWAGSLLILAGLFDFFDGSLARLSGQVTPFGAFLDSVIDRYSDLLVLLGILFFFIREARTGAILLTMATLIGTIMVSYTKARAQAIGVACEVGLMERPERLLCLIAGALFHLLTPALWVLAILVNVTALQRILVTHRVVSSQTIR
jgi:CDP-diacylglycerol--glycerol-3-phosphate 3-phosphatidyltransferase